MDQRKYLASEINRVEETKDDITALGESDSMMLALMEVLSPPEPVPLPGRYYTFIYKAKTPRIEYDTFPLIACLEVYEWGFRGVNYHWGDFRNYDWEEVQSLFYLVYPAELSDMRSIPYQNFTINN
jgi:hypothetical protein